ncbi:MAG: ribosome biogenesis GTP-binding protein YihA/YsxC [Deltaproteobacteria bacterium]|jgi:GTP-binding protein|nr:ribosome biogenesis GTP-binding protein YihA/YsxC [Deltaproteobacteria bacterium]
MPTAPPALSADFVLGAASARQFPEPLGFELAFLGRSNCGKSSLLNYFLGRKGLARVSSTPGRTREVNFFKVILAKGAEPFWVADLPGYGFAQAPKAQVEAWGPLAESYLAAKRGQKAFLLMDARRKLADEERLLLGLLGDLSVPLILVLTKCDKLTRSETIKRRKELERELGGRAPVALSSALKGQGREGLMAQAIPSAFLGSMGAYLSGK